MAASYPSSVKSFATHADNDTIEPSHVNDLQLEVSAIEDALLNGFTHALKPAADQDLGSSSFKWRDLFLSRNLTMGGTFLSDLLFLDATYDIGKSGATRPRDGFFSRNVAIGGTLGVTGVATLTAKPVVQAGIQFPATQAADADVNTLDDYEEGNWTPVIGGAGGTSGQTYSTQVGRYIKIGKLVTCWGQCTFTAKGTITGNVQIQGLPFTSATQVQMGAVVITFFQALATAYLSLYGFVTSASTNAPLYTLVSTGVNTLAMVTSDLGNTTGFSFMITYEAAN